MMHRHPPLTIWTGAGAGGQGQEGNHLRWNGYRVSLLQSDMRFTVNDLIHNSDKLVQKVDARSSAERYIQAGGDVTVWY